jgi:xanthine dehydrogenase accessory factor
LFVSEMKNIYLQIPDLQSADSALVLATVTRTRGSTPQKPGSSALFGPNGLISGTVGGGVVEGRVGKLATDAIESGNSDFHHFTLANDISESDEAICGGEISVLTDARLADSLEVFEQIKHSLAKRVPGVIVTRVTANTETKVMINRFWISDLDKPSIPAELLSKIDPEVRKLISAKNPSGFSELEIGNPGEVQSSLYFLQPLFPPDQLIIAGAGHIGKALAHLGALLDFEVTVIDDRKEFANSINIPDADYIIVKDIGEAMKELDKKENTYVVIVTRGHKDDAAALKPCLGKGLAYTGMIGSRSKISAMRIRFIEQGWATYAQWDQVHAPVGIAIKSQTVEEIAVSIAAELVLVRNSKS